MSERRYRKPALDARRHEWVELDGGPVCVRELTVRELMVILERCTRPQALGGGIDANEEVTWKVLLSCYCGPEPDAEPIWSPDPHGLSEILALRMEEFGLLAAAVGRVNGRSRDEVDALMGFTEPSGAENSSRSPGSASST